MLPFALGLAAATCVGVGDFAAGVAARRLSPVLVGFWAQGIAVVFSAIVLFVVRPPLVAGQIPWALAVGVAAGVGLALMYRAMAIGALALVAPITACSVVFPVIYAVAHGEQIRVPAAVGIVVIVAGVVLASAQPSAVAGLPAEAGGSGERRAAVLAIAAAVVFGAFYIMIDVAPQAGGWGALWTAGPARLSAFGVQALLVALGPRRLSGPGRYAPHVAAAGVLDQMSLILLGLGAMTNAYGIVTVLLGLYPVITAVLGVVLLGERLTRVQSSGATLALVGVVLVGL